MLNISYSKLISGLQQHRKDRYYNIVRAFKKSKVEVALTTRKLKLSSRAINNEILMKLSTLPLSKLKKRSKNPQNPCSYRTFMASNVTYCINTCKHKVMLRKIYFTSKKLLQKANNGSPFIMLLSANFPTLTKQKKKKGFTLSLKQSIPACKKLQNDGQMLFLDSQDTQSS